MVSVSAQSRSLRPIQTNSGLISGVTGSNGVTAFLGVPFAKAPVGELRWRPPQPPAPWQGVRRADHFGASCMQPRIASLLPWTEEFMTQGELSEDCLFLNVWTAAQPGEKQAVMVFIHGGGFGGGSGSIAVYNGARLAEKGVVIVTVNYRVGVLGFLVHPELTRESEHHSSGNYGLLDQIAALEWIRDNIAAFGGDPTQVTIFGQSAGAMSVTCLMRSPLAQGLFARAIAQSTPENFMPPGKDSILGSTNIQEREQDGVKYAGKKGAHSLAELRKLPAEEFYRSTGFISDFRGGPVYDGWVLSEKHPQHEVPLMTGIVAGDVNMVDGFGPQPQPTVAWFEDSAREKFGNSAPEFLKLYPVKQDSNVPTVKQASREDEGRVSVDLWSAEQLKHSPAVYTYFFDRAIPWPAHPEFGAFHTAEVPYIFRNLRSMDRPWQPVDEKLSETISSYWVNFAKTGDPSGPGLAKWPAYNPAQHVTMELGERTGPMPNAAPERLRFLLNFADKH